MHERIKNTLPKLIWKENKAEIEKLMSKSITQKKETLMNMNSYKFFI